MTILQIVDNPDARPLNDDMTWLEALEGEPATADRLLLIGFSPDDLIAIRRRLAGRFGEAAITSFMTDSERWLREVDPALVELAIASVITGISPEETRWIGHAGQRTRHLSEPTPPLAQPISDRTRPQLAFVSPLPPEPTGIADYSAELLPYLAAHYDITLVVDQQKVDPTLSGHFPVIDSDAFDARAGDFDRVLYQVGNSLYHAYQFALLRRHPGLVVMHDVFLFDAVCWLEESRRWSDGLRRQLFQDHGYVGVLDLESVASAPEKGVRGPEHFPVNGFVTREAAGLVFHSAFARALDRRWRPDARHEPAAVIPHLRKLPGRDEGARRREARRALGIGEEVRLIASFGAINPKKMTDVLLDAVLEGPLLDAPPGGHENVRLVLVGAQHGGEFGQRLAEQLRTHPNGSRVTVTGFVDREHYERWLHAADIAVQLRRQSRGETSGAILDAMAHGLAVVANAHGSSAELPSDTLEMLPENVTAAQLAERLQALVAASSHCAALGERARRYVAERLDPVRIANDYRDAIEAAARDSLRGRREHWLDQLAKNRVLRRLGQANRLLVARELCTLDATVPGQLPRILFDVSAIAWHDLKTGIERVTRRIADHLLRDPPVGWRVEPIRWGGDDFYLARGFASDQLGIVPPALDRPCEARPGDIYVSLEWAPPLLEQAGDALQALRARGVRCYFTVHDLLPLFLPECFPSGIPDTMRRWFDAIAELADGITCVSAQVAKDVRRELDSLPGGHRPWVAHFHLGADFTGEASPASCFEPGEHQLLATIALAPGPTMLMVGTIEPRKGHRQVLDALERLWQQDVAFNLVIVGKQGWKVDDLMQRLERHPRRGGSLFHVQGASDALLQRLYAQSDCLLAASLGEGFGLPLIEAARHGIPILARDIPVFREVAGEHADYFRAETPESLAEALASWCQRWRAGEVRDSGGMPHQSWAQSTQQWLGHILADLPDPSGERHS